MTFEDLCKRWSISPYSSHSTYYKVLKDTCIIDAAAQKPYKVDTEALLEYERRVGFKPGMVSVAEYVRLHKGISKYKVLQMIKHNEVESCILCSSQKSIYYRVKK